MIYFSKVLPLLVLPVSITLLLIVLGLWRRRHALIVAGVLVLWVTSTPLVGQFAIRAAERFATRVPIDSAPRADAIVVLSEGRIVAPGQAGISEWRRGNRFFAGVQLFKAAKAPLLVFTGGASPWEPKAALEGDLLTRFAVEMGVPDSAITRTGAVNNTAEEAQAVAKLLRARGASSGLPGSSPLRIVLVTSAFHMPRAQRLFERAGLSVAAYPVDFRVSAGSKLSVLNFLPTATALQDTEVAMREGYGRLFYFIVR